MSSFAPAPGAGVGANAAPPTKVKRVMTQAINLIYDLIRIFLKSSCKNYYFIILRHKLNKLNTAWTHQKEAILTIFYIMD
jgi:hypothetical protein